jgi:hypothetical protein
MGSSRGWAAEKEDETVTCIYGNEHRYFDNCRCRGCTLDREHVRKVSTLSDKVRSIVHKKLTTAHPQTVDEVYEDIIKKLSD